MKPYRQSILSALALATPLFLVVSGARADAIDGNWCHDDGRRFTIRGAEIVTPGGKTMSGNYSRHYYDYRAPAGERDAGQSIHMTLYSENVVHLRVGDAATTPEIWRRCAPSISGIGRPPHAA